MSLSKMSQKSDKDQDKDQYQDICFMCQWPNDESSLPIPCLNNHSEGIHEVCLEEYFKKFSDCYCRRKLFIPKYKYESIPDYWFKCGRGRLRQQTTILHGFVIFEDFMNSTVKVTKKFNVRADSLVSRYQYPGGPIISRLILRQESCSITFSEKNTILVIDDIKDRKSARDEWDTTLPFFNEGSNRQLIPKNKSIYEYWTEFAGGEIGTKMFFGSVTFKDFDNDNIVTYRFKLADTLLKKEYQYPGGPMILKLGSDLDFITFSEEDTILNINHVSERKYWPEDTFTFFDGCTHLI